MIIAMNLYLLFAALAYEILWENDLCSLKRKVKASHNEKTTATKSTATVITPFMLLGLANKLSITSSTRIAVYFPVYYFLSTIARF
jgi:hypothetical protein